MSDIVKCGVMSQDDINAALFDEVQRLRRELSEARNNALEEAANITEGEITRAIFDSFVFNGETAVNRQGHDLFMSVVHVEELLSSRAAAIRAAMEKAE